MNEIAIAEVIGTACLIGVFLYSLMFFFPRFLFSVSVGLSVVFLMHDSVLSLPSTTTKLYAMVFFFALAIFGFSLDTEMGRKQFHILIKGPGEDKEVNSRTFIWVLICLIASTVVFGLVLSNFFVATIVLLFFFILPRTGTMIIVNLLVTKNANWLADVFGGTSIPVSLWAISILAGFIGLAIDLPEARQFLWLVKPRKKKAWRGPVCLT